MRACGYFPPCSLSPTGPSGSATSGHRLLVPPATQSCHLLTYAIDTIPTLHGPNYQPFLIHSERSDSLILTFIGHLLSQVLGHRETHHMEFLVSQTNQRRAHYLIIAGLSAPKGGTEDYGV